MRKFYYCLPTYIYQPVRPSERKRSYRGRDNIVARAKELMEEFGSVNKA